MVLLLRSKSEIILWHNARLMVAEIKLHYSRQVARMQPSAMTMALPLIAPNYGDAVEMIENGKTGLLFKSGDAQDLAGKIRTQYHDSALRKDM